VHLRKAKQQN